MLCCIILPICFFSASLLGRSPRATATAGTPTLPLPLRHQQFSANRQEARTAAHLTRLTAAHLARLTAGPRIRPTAVHLTRLTAGHRIRPTADLIRRMVDLTKGLVSL